RHARDRSDVVRPKHRLHRKPDRTFGDDRGRQGRPQGLRRKAQAVVAGEVANGTTWILIRISNSGGTRVRAFSRCDAPELCKTMSLENVEGAGKAGCPMHPRLASNKKAHERRHHRFTATVRPSLRNGFNGL